MEYNITAITKRKDGRFMGRFIIDHKENGKPVYQYVYGKSYREAEQKLKIAYEIEVKYRYGVKNTVSKIYKEWLCAVSNRIKESTYANYRMKFEKHLLPFFGEMECASITSSTINAFIKSKTDKGLSSGYIRDIYTVFKTFLFYAEEEYSFKLSLKNVSLPKEEHKNNNIINDEQYKRLIRFIITNPDIIGLGVFLSMFMGLRIGEVCGLKWIDIDIENKIIHINRTVQRICIEDGNAKTKVVITEPKSDSSKRCLAIPDFLITFLEKFKSKPEHYMISDSLTPAEPRIMQYRYRKLLKEAETKITNYHQLRHCFASSCIKNGFDAKTVSSALGHNSIELTLKRYVHTDIHHERKMMNSLSCYIECQPVSDKES